MKYRWWILTVVFAIAMFFVIPFVIDVAEVLAYSRLQRSTDELVRTLQERRPNDVPHDAWDAATGWAITAYVNVCFSPSHVSYEELEDFTADLKQKFNSEVDLRTIDWIWQRLSETGPAGERYLESWWPTYRYNVDEALQKADEESELSAEEPQQPNQLQNSDVSTGVKRDQR